jgi:hypothetical protein
MENNGNADFINQQALEMYLTMSGFPKNADIDVVENIWWRMMLGREVANHTWDENMINKVYQSIKPWKRVAWMRALEVLIGRAKFPQSWKRILEERANYLE